MPILVSSTKNLESVATATMNFSLAKQKDFEVSIANSGLQFRTVIDFQFRFLAYNKMGSTCGIA